MIDRKGYFGSPALRDVANTEGLVSLGNFALLASHCLLQTEHPGHNAGQPKVNRD